MGSRVARIAMMAALAACGSKSDPKPEAKSDKKPDEPPAKQVDKNVDTTATRPDQPVAKGGATPVSEVVTSTFFRPAGGTATLRYPELDGDGWKTALDDKSANPSLTFDFASSAGRAQLQVLFPPRSDTALPAEAVARAAATEVAATFGGTIEAGKALGTSRHLFRIRSKPGAPEAVSTLLALVDGRDAVLILATGTETSLKAPPFQAAIKQIIEGLKVGSQVAHPPAVDPGKPVDGVYIKISTTYGAYNSLVFDPRGYVHSRDDLVADLDAVWAIEDGGLGHYAYDGKRLLVTWPTNGRTMEGEVTADAVTLDGVRYCKVSGSAPATLDGHWEAAIAPYQSSNPYDTFNVKISASLYFRKDGAFGSASGVYADHTNTVGSPSEAPEVHASATDHSQGRYQIAHDRLTLTYGDGTSDVRTIFTSCGADPTAVIFVGGSLYIRD